MEPSGIDGNMNGNVNGETNEVINGKTEHRRLCLKCLELDLAPDKFIIDSSSASVQTAHLRSYHPHPARTSSFTDTRLNSGLGPRFLGPLSELERKENCPLCSLISQAIRRYADSNLKLDPACFWEWSVDGRLTRASLSGAHHRSNVTRRLRISWSASADGTHQESKTGSRSHEIYLLLVPPKDQISNALDILDARSVSLGRDFSDGGVQALMRKWIDICDGQHRHVCGRIEGFEAFRELTRQTSFGVIDVINLKLTRLPVHGDRPDRYVALSYVWGPKRTEDHRTLRSNVFDRIRHGGLDKKILDTLPQTVRHAIQLVRDLGERYLWVDALCIVQDSDTCWKQNAKNMDLIYGNAHFTICAADGDNADVGLIATGFGTEAPDTPLKDKVLPGIELLVSRPLEEVVHNSTWNNRAWTFQERILSRRCLVFVGRRVYFQCRAANMSQDVYPGGSGDDWSLDWRDSPLRTLRDAKERPIWFYMKCVSLYTGRRLTLPKDILPAFDGVSQLMARYMVAPFYYCLPASHFDFTLLWQPSRAHKRRRPQARHGDLSCRKNSAGECICRQESDGFGSTEFPSWSWAGWMDRDDPQKGAHVTYDNRFLEGCLLDMHEWLTERTWIDWTIRDSEGNLMDIWQNYSDALRKRHSNSYRHRDFERGGDVAQDRWMGYQAPPGPRDDTRELVITRRTVSRAASYEHGDDAPGDVDYGGRSYSPGPQVRSRSRARDEEDAELDHVLRERTRAVDRYGRSRRTRQTGHQLRAPIPDNPFGNRPSQQAPTDDPSSALPILQFYTWSSKFYVLASPEAATPGDGLVRCHVADQTHDWCGTVILSEDWAAAHSGRLCQFIALSDAKSFTEEECKHWAHYIAKDRDEIEWDLFHVLLIEYNPHRLLWERVGIGKVLQQAFDVGPGSEQWTEIQLG